MKMAGKTAGSTRSADVQVTFLHRLVLYVMLLAMVSLVRAAVPVPDIPLPQDAKQCVQPKSIMRREHFNFLYHQRDETMRRGIRTKRYSLVNCVSCHAQKDAKQQYIPINEKGQFCSSCHEYTAVKIDCFECHATVPVSKSAGQ
ncbi:MAG TPA: Hdr-like menaquinol oxidoreductase cytochrome c subunit [Gammaproteobacteria bacterium]|nr:Hdr-like menaquinol oxidoreductase cytochrome c subunit [Gammaproteobacteria bacterium]